MIINSAVRAWCIANAGVASTITDQKVFADAVSDALESGELTAEKLAELQAESDPLTDEQLRALAKQFLQRHGDELAGLSDSQRRERVAQILADNHKGGTMPTDLLRVKNPSERYSTKKYEAKHAKTGETVRGFNGEIVETISEQEHAKAGAFLKWKLRKSGAPVELTEHDRALLGEMAERSTWLEIQDGSEKVVEPGRVKALLDDVTSGGLEVTPIEFDSNLITFPLLHGELFPMVDLVEVGRGRRIEGASVGNPTVTWGTSEGTEANLFDTTSLVSAIDTTIHNVDCAVEVGLDFLSDSPADVGRILTMNIGQRMAAELDKVIASGDGSTQPQGIDAATGSDIGNPSGGAGADPTVTDYETLLFAVGKQYRNASMRCAFIGNDTTYSRARGIAVGASDERRVFGMDHQSYMLLQYPFKVQNDLANNFAGFVALAKYRLYRRVGQQVRFEQGGKELTRKNLGLLMVRGRFGGKLMDSNAYAYSDNWKA